MFCDVNFDVMWGEVVGVIGLNGVGKFMLLKIFSCVSDLIIG